MIEQGDIWWFIEAKDNSCRGYLPAQNKEEACEKFGLRAEECIIKKVAWSGEEFVEVDQAIQGTLL